MRLPKFDHSACRWDTYRAFHMHLHLGFVMFDTGELIYTRHYARPAQRGIVEQLNVALFTMYDQLPFMKRLTTPDGKHVPISSLNNRMYLYDIDTGRVVSLGYKHKSDHPHIPARFKGLCTAYFPGAGQPPVAKSCVSAWHRKPPPERKEVYRENLNLLKVTAKIRGIQPRSWCIGEILSAEELFDPTFADSLGSVKDDTIAVTLHSGPRPWLNEYDHLMVT